jgi:hypothetical protein
MTASAIRASFSSNLFGTPFGVTRRLLASLNRAVISTDSTGDPTSQVAIFIATNYAHSMSP